MEKEPIYELLNSEEILLYLIGRRLVNLNINISKDDVNKVKELSKGKEIDEIVKIMMKKYRNYTDDDYRRCQLSISCL